MIKTQLIDAWCEILTYNWRCLNNIYFFLNVGSHKSRAYLCANVNRFLHYAHLFLCRFNLWPLKPSCIVQQFIKHKKFRSEFVTTISIRHKNNNSSSSRGLKKSSKFFFSVCKSLWAFQIEFWYAFFSSLTLTFKKRFANHVYFCIYSIYFRLKKKFCLLNYKGLTCLMIFNYLQSLSQFKKIVLFVSLKELF